MSLCFVLGSFSIFHVSPDLRAGSLLVPLLWWHWEPLISWTRTIFWSSTRCHEASPAMSSIPQAPNDSFRKWYPASGTDRGCHNQGGVQPDFRQKIRSKVQRTGKGIGSGEGERVKKKCHELYVKEENHKIDKWLQGTMSRQVWLNQRKNKIFIQCHRHWKITPFSFHNNCMSPEGRPLPSLKAGQLISIAVDWLAQGFGLACGGARVHTRYFHLHIQSSLCSKGVW